MNLQPPPIDRHAEAIVEITSMRDTIISLRERITILELDLSRERDRVALLTEERARWRTDAMACRTFVTKLATILEHVNTATTGAAAILDDMAQMDSNETPKAAVDETTASVEEQLKKLRDIENGNITVETMSEGARTHSLEHSMERLLHTVSNPQTSL